MSTVAKLLSEDRMTMADAGKVASAHPVSVWRWCTVGIGNVRLEHYRCGRKKFTTRQALMRFLERTTASGIGEEPPASPANHARRNAAKSRLQSKGVLSPSAA